MVIVTPVIGRLIVGVMAKYGTSKIKGHGIPEAMDAVLSNGSRIAPRVAIMKPISAAIAIGTGGPFEAEGPVIQTGGAIGSLVGQAFHAREVELESGSRPCIVPKVKFLASGFVLPTDGVFDYPSAILRARALWGNVYPMATAESKRLPYYPRSPLLRASAQYRLRVIFRCRSACLPVKHTIQR